METNDTAPEPKIRVWYTHSPEQYSGVPHSARWEFGARCEHGAVTLHFDERDPEHWSEIAPNGWSGGLEIHYAKWPGYGSKKPTRKLCEYLGAPCWHDGTTAYVVDYVLPTWRYQRQPDYWLNWIRFELKRRFYPHSES